MSRNKNVLFITVDQLRADCVFGDLASHIELPHLRALMADAVTFARHYTVTNPCGPSRTSMLTRAICDEPPIRAQWHALAP